MANPTWKAKPDESGRWVVRYKNEYMGTFVFEIGDPLPNGAEMYYGPIPECPKPKSVLRGKFDELINWFGVNTKTHNIPLVLRAIIAQLVEDVEELKSQVNPKGERPGGKDAA